MVRRDTGHRNILRIGLDIDDTISLFMQPYLERFGKPKNDYVITKNVFRVLRFDKNFWLNVPIKNIPDFEVTLYCTKRVNPKSWTKEFIKKHNLPNAPVYQVYCQNKNKADVIKGRVDVFIDDSVSNCEAMISKGIPCLLMDTDWNKYCTHIPRVYTLNYAEISEQYTRYYA